MQDGMKDSGAGRDHVHVDLGGVRDSCRLAGHGHGGLITMSCSIEFS